MCTVTYIPLDQGFLLTSSRDENILRGTALTPRVYDSNGNRLLYPMDADRSGTWIAAKENGDAIVLLNGAFEKHLRKPPYRKSRGHVVLEIISAPDPCRALVQADFSNIEPFTLILWSEARLLECRWDGHRKHLRTLDSQKAQIWSSVTLYDASARQLREGWFNRWDSHTPITSMAQAIGFHTRGGNRDPENGLVIDRAGRMKTVSVTSMQITNNGAAMHYLDLRTAAEIHRTLPIPKTAGKDHKAPSGLVLAIRRFFIRLFHWEYWPLFALYGPIFFYWVWLSARARSLFFHIAANPTIDNGGFALESKAKIAQLIPENWTPKTLLFLKHTPWYAVEAALWAHQMNYPLVAKPDVGGKGVLVQIVRSPAELRTYIERVPVDYLIQAFVPYKKEAGIFYCRIPGQSKGRITGIVGKEFLQIVGDGTSTIRELILAEPRSLLQYDALRKTLGTKLSQIPEKGDRLTLAPYGNHARGAKFLDLSHLIDEEFHRSWDQICDQIPGFYFGRLDVMYDDWNDLKKGRNFSIVELNGAGSEPTHIYDPGHSLFYAWKEIIRHWKLLYRISVKNHRERAVPYPTFRQGMTLLKKNSDYLKLVS